ncbi:MAG: hypothetical protein ACE5EV_03235 [Gaiellales bacterium]
MTAPDPPPFDAETAAEVAVPPAPPRRSRRDRRRRRWRAVRWFLGLVVLVAVFVIGLSLGRALEETPQPGGEQTGIRTLQPTSVGPARTVTVTVTVGE